MIARFVVVAACVVAASCGGSHTGTEVVLALDTVGPPRFVSHLEWMSGDWRSIVGDTLKEERWGEPLGGLMIGTGRTLTGKRGCFFEYLRIEDRPDGLVYVASPLGEGSTEFKFADGGPRRVRFENRQHDWPTAIEYELSDNGRMTARVSGPGKTEESVWERVR